MAQRAIININGDLIPFSEDLDRIRTPGLGGSAVTWVPDADTICDQLKVTANGTYSAAEAGKYGYDYVFVSVPGSSVTGRDPDTGEEVEVHPDPETGEIVTTVLPTEIRVITPPAKTDYADGETIDYSGIVVHAYSSTGQDLGVVPFGELVFPETTADVQKTDGWSDGQGLNAMQIAYTPHWNRAEWAKIYPGRIDESQVFVCGTALGTQDGRPATYGAASGDTPGTLFVTRYYRYGKYYNYMASMAGNRGCDKYVYYAGELTDGGQRILTGWFDRGGTSARAGNKVFSKVGWEEYLTDIPISTVAPTTVDPANLHAIQSLPVQWSRTGDGAVLETSFNIQVNSAA